MSEPKDLYEKQRTVEGTHLETPNKDGKTNLEDTATVDPEIREKFNL